MTLVDMEDELYGKIMLALEQSRVAKEAADKALDGVTKLEGEVRILEQRVEKYEGKVDAILGTTSEIKSLLTTNGRDTKSAKRNAKGWGFLSVFVSIAFKLAEIFCRNGIAL